MHPQAGKIQQALIAAGCDSQVREMPESTRTAAEAAQAVGSTVGQIVKSLIFILEPPGTPVLILVSGANRVNETALGERLGGQLRKADAAFVQSTTGYVIGGVPPLAHDTLLQTYLDEDLLQYDEIWAAAGTPRAVFPIAPSDLLLITGAVAIKVI